MTKTNIRIIAVDKFKPLLMTKGDDVDDNDYINASFFDVSKDDIPFFTNPAHLPNLPKRKYIIRMAY